MEVAEKGHRENINTMEHKFFTEKVRKGARSAPDSSKHVPQSTFKPSTNTTASGPSFLFIILLYFILFVVSSFVQFYPHCYFPPCMALPDWISCNQKGPADFMSSLRVTKIVETMRCKKSDFENIVME